MRPAAACSRQLGLTARCTSSAWSAIFKVCPADNIEPSLSHTDELTHPAQTLPYDADRAHNTAIDSLHT